MLLSKEDAIMFGFLFGVAAGAAGFWAYQSFGKDLLGLGGDDTSSMSYGGSSSYGSGSSSSEIGSAGSGSSGGSYAAGSPSPSESGGSASPSTPGSKGSSGGSSGS